MTSDDFITLGDLKDLETIFKAILQFYRKRLTFMSQRYHILSSTKRTFNNFDKENFMSLSRILRAENRIIQILRKEFKEGKDHIEYALYKFEYYLKHKPGLRKLILQEKRVHIEIKRDEYDRLLRNTIAFLKKAMEDLTIIGFRMYQEEKFLANKDEDQFHELLSAWDAEMKANLDLIKLYVKIYRGCNKVMEKTTINDQKYDRKWTLISVGSAIGMGGSYLYMNTNVIWDIGMMAFGLLLILLGFFYDYKNISYEALVQIHKDEKIIKRLNEVGIVNYST